jgi:PST family polysaccharide transporter
VRGGATTMIGQCSKFLLQTTSTIVLARLLTPADFGMIAMVTAVIRFADLFKDLGLSMATIQKSEINHDQISTLFWINIIFSLMISLLTTAMSPIIAWFYNQPQLISITIALSVVFVFGGLAVQHQSLLQRQMRFKELVGIQIISMLAGILAAIVAANYGFGYWALVIMQIMAAIFNALGVWLLCSWRPGRPSWNVGVGSMLNFGFNLTGATILNYFARNLDKVQIGRF